MLALVVLEGIAVALLAVLVVGLLRSHAEVLRRLHDLGADVYENEASGAAGTTTGVTMPVEIKTQPGVAEPRPAASQPGISEAHDIAGATPDGAAIVAGVRETAHTTLVAFLTSGCATCQNFWQAFGAGDADALPGRDTRLVIVTAGPDRESPSAVAAVAPPKHTTVMSSEAWDDYGVPVSPYFILVDGPSSRVIGEGAAATWAQVFDLLSKAVADAGIDAEGRALVTPKPQGRLNGAQRRDRADDELRNAGIGPGDPSLYPDSIDGVADVSGDADTDHAHLHRGTH